MNLVVIEETIKTHATVRTVDFDEKAYEQKYGLELIGDPVYYGIEGNKVILMYRYIDKPISRASPQP